MPKLDNNQDIRVRTSEKQVLLTTNYKLFRQDSFTGQFRQDSLTGQFRQDSLDRTV